MSGTKMYSFRLPTGLVERVDAVAENRTAFFVQSVEAALGGGKNSTAALQEISDLPDVRADEAALIAKAALAIAGPVSNPVREKPPVKRSSGSSSVDWDRAMAALGAGGRTERQLAQELGWFEGRVAKVVKEMEECGLVRRGAEGRVEAV